MDLAKFSLDTRATLDAEVATSKTVKIKTL